MGLPVVIEPFTPATFTDLQNHVAHLRRLFDWPGIPYHDAGREPQHTFNRWAMHNPPVIRALHHRHQFIERISTLVGQEVKPSYAFLSMYGPDGVCPEHTDRPQCAYTCDLMVRSDTYDDPWLLHVAGRKFHLDDGQAIVYSGTGQPHYREPMHESSDATFCDLVFFHFVPVSFQGPLD